MVRYFILSLLLLTAAFLQSALFTFNLLLLLVLLAAFTFPEAVALMVAFLAGFLLDLFSAGALGLSSLGFLLPSFFLLLYRRRFSFRHPFSVFAAGFLANVLFVLIVRQRIFWLEGLVVSLSLVSLRLLFPFLFESVADREKFKVRL